MPRARRAGECLGILTGARVLVVIRSSGAGRPQVVPLNPGLRERRR
jgi:hypothetical protein